MLFNSYEFIFLYAPIVISVYFLLGRRSGKSWYANVWLIAASLFFYAYWDIRYLPLLLFSIAANYFASGVIMSCRKAKQRARAKLSFALALAFDAGLLGFFKYTDFFLANLNCLGADFPLPHIVLPLGISFFTITQMVYLVDCYEGVAKERQPVNYALFVSFFPHLLAGPILYHKAMMRQFNDEGRRRVNWENMSRGLALFAIGLAKKTIIADTLSPYVGSGFSHAGELQMLQAWLTAASYMLQLYFDFSGYSDMAVGLARMMNINIPINFNCPYRAYGIINYWGRWHMSLTTTITNYLYTPLVMACRRITFAKAMLATFLAMFIAGIWHGAGWTYIIFGSLHGVGLVVNHVWKKYHLWMWRPLGYALTLLLVLVSLVFFRAADVSQALGILRAMAGGNGLMWPQPVAALLSGNGVAVTGGDVLSGLPVAMFTAALLLVASAPSSNDIAARIRPSGRWALALAALAVAALLSVTDASEFLYFQF